jgi:hypothetical protein
MKPSHRSLLSTTLKNLETPFLAGFIQEGVSEAELGVLPLYKFKAFHSNEKNITGPGKMVPIPINGLCLATERTLLAEDAVNTNLV